MARRSALLLFVAALLAAGAPRAEPRPVRAAVAANFAPTLHAVVAAHVAAGGEPVEVIVGSTGRLFAQIVNGAPFDLFFAADAERPARLVEQGRVPPEARRPYAVGRLVLWSPDPELVDPAGRVLEDPAGRRLAVANPRLAPYGRAAVEALTALGVETRWRPREVTGETVGQALQYVESGNADLGLVALALLGDRAGSRWVVPDSLHAPIEQHVVLLGDAPAARALLDFLASPAGAALLAADGYELPEARP